MKSRKLNGNLTKITGSLFSKAQENVCLQWKLTDFLFVYDMGWVPVPLQFPLKNVVSQCCKFSNISYTIKTSCAKLYIHEEVKLF